MTPAQQKYREAYADLIRRRGAAKAGLRPSASFTAVLLALLDTTSPAEVFEWGCYVTELAALTQLDQGNLSVMLRRMREEYGLVATAYETASRRVLRRKQRAYHRLTDEGLALAELAADAERPRGDDVAPS